MAGAGVAALAKHEPAIVIAVAAQKAFIIVISDACIEVDIH
jgi:hypothetical protein